MPKVRSDDCIQDLSPVPRLRPILLVRLLTIASQRFSDTRSERATTNSL